MRGFDSSYLRIAGGTSLALLLLLLVGAPLAARQLPPALIHEHIQTVTVSPGGKFTLRDRLVVTIYRSEAAELAKLQVPYSSSIKVKDLVGTVHDLQGNTRYKFKKSDVEDYSNFSSFSIYEDNRVKVLDLRQTQYPYKATLEFEIELPNLYYVPNWVPQRYPSIPVEKASITYLYPEETEIRFLSRHLDDARYAQRQEGKLHVQSWEIGPLSAYTPEPMAVIEEQRKPMLLASPGKFAFDGNSGDLSSWEEMGRWFYALNADKRDLSAQTKADVQTLVAGLSDDMEKAEALYHYMQGRTRYVSIQLGIGGLVPFEAKSVEKNGFGDCKALSNYMGALLDEVGIPNFYTLIHAGEQNKPFFSAFPADYFNHAILAVPLEKDTVFLECTSQQTPFGFLGDFTSDRHALLITPEGGKLVKTPTYRAEVNIQKQVGKFQLDEGANLSGQVSLIRSALQSDLGGMLQLPYAKESAKMDWIQRMYRLPNLSVADYGFERTGNLLPEIHFQADLQAKKVGQLAGGRIILQPNQWNTLETGLRPTKQQREGPFRISMGYTDEDEISYILPKGFEVDQLPQAIELEMPFGYFKTALAYEAGMLLFRRELQVKEGKYAPELFNEYVSFLEQVERADKQKVILRKSP